MKKEKRLITNITYQITLVHVNILHYNIRDRYYKNVNKLNQSHLSEKSCSIQLQGHKHKQPPYH